MDEKENPQDLWYDSRFIISYSLRARRYYNSKKESFKELSMRWPSLIKFLKEKIIDIIFSLSWIFLQRKIPQKFQAILCSIKITKKKREKHEPWRAPTIGSRMTWKSIYKKIQQSLLYQKLNLRKAPLSWFANKRINGKFISKIKWRYYFQEVKEFYQGSGFVHGLNLFVFGVFELDCSEKATLKFLLGAGVAVRKIYCVVDDSQKRRLFDLQAFCWEYETRWLYKDSFWFGLKAFCFLVCISSACTEWVTASNQLETKSRVPKNIYEDDFGVLLCFSEPQLQRKIYLLIKKAEIMAVLPFEE